MIVIFFLIGHASLYGYGHYKTFDGKMFDYPNSCPNTFVTSEESLGFSIITDRKSCEGKSCWMDVVVAYKDQQVKFSKEENQEFNLKVNSIASTLPFVSDKGFRISKSSTMFIKFESTDGIHVLWDGKTRLYVKVPASFKNQLAGLAGNFNGKTIDDFVTPLGDSSHSEIDFGNSWLVQNLNCSKLSTDLKLTPCEDNHQNVLEAENRCNIINSNIFKPCHSVLDPSAYYENCKQDVCGCQNGNECLCGVLSAYASECAIHGREIAGWREASGCGM